MMFGVVRFLDQLVPVGIDEDTCGDWLVPGSAVELRQRITGGFIAVVKDSSHASE
jgi:hypothetical protein